MKTLIINEREISLDDAKKIGKYPYGMSTSFLHDYYCSHCGKELRGLYINGYIFDPQKEMSGWSSWCDCEGAKIEVDYRLIKRYGKEEIDTYKKVNMIKCEEEIEKSSKEIKKKYGYN
jgi:hypothetical protein